MITLEELEISTGDEWVTLTKKIKEIIGNDKYQTALRKRAELNVHMLTALHLQGIFTYHQFQIIAYEHFKEKMDLIKGNITNIDIEITEDNKYIFIYKEKGKRISDIIPCWIPSSKRVKKQIILTFDEYEKLINNISSNQQEKSIHASIERVSFEFHDIVKRAYEKKSSDIHINYSNDLYYVFFRINGELIEQPEFLLTQKDGYEFVKAIKIEASAYSKGKFNADQHFIAQDARISYTDIGTDGVDVRLEFIPDGNMTNIALIARILKHKKLEKPDFESMGYDKNLIDIFHQISMRRNGLSIASGITGSGKSTLISNLLLLIDEKKRIYTIEDPIEFQLANSNITQHQIYLPKDKENQMGFLEYVKALKRGDPDIVNIGEMRNDPALIEAIMEMSEAGQLVFTTLHITSAFAIYQTLEQIFGVKKEISIPLVLFSINQTLVKSLCPYCKEEDKENINIERLKEFEKSLPYLYKEPLKKLFNTSLVPKLYLKGKGCKNCDWTGYSKRIPIYEYIYPNVEFIDWMSKNKPTRYTIEEKACSEGLGKNKLQVFIERLLEGIVDTSDPIIYKIM